MKEFAFCIVMVLMVGSALPTVAQNGQTALSAGVLAPPSAQANETLWLDMFGWSRPVAYSSNTLDNGSKYLITIEGTWSIWASSHWLSVDDPPVGAFEEAPMYESGIGAGTGRVGSDPFFAFACIYGWDYADGMGWSSLPTGSASMSISLDGGTSWTYLRPVNDVYNSSHRYALRVTGQGLSVGFRSVDAQAEDNYGKLKIVIEPEATVPSVPQNLTAIAGDGSVSLAWDAPINDGGSPVTNYTLYRGPDPGNMTLLAKQANVTSFLDGNVTNRNTYYYAVSASNAMGEGAASEAVGCMPDWPEHYPSCAITAPAAGYVNTSDVAMTWTMSDAVSGIDYAEVRLDSGGWISMGDATSHVFTGVPDGGHSLSLRVYNHAGYDNATSCAITVDTAHPTNVANSWSQATVSGTLVITFSEAMGSAQGSVDGQPVAFSVLDRNATASVTLAPGQHELIMTGTDLAGNALDYYAPFAFNVAVYTVPVSGRVMDSDGAPVSGAHVDIDGVQATTGADGRFSCSVAPGQHDINITAAGIHDYHGDVTVTEESSELGDFTVSPLETPSGDGGMDWLPIAIAAIAGLVLLAALLLFLRRKKGEEKK